SRIQRAEAEVGAAYAFSSPLARHEHGLLTSADPLHSFSRALDSSEDRICAMLVNGPVPHQQLAGIGADAALRRLIAAGLVVQVTATAESDVETVHVDTRHRG